MAKSLEVAQASDGEDRFTLLPDDILVHNILPLLPMKEAARTSILARRWRSLWLYVPSQDFDASEKAACVPLNRWKTVFPEGGGPAESNYVEWVDGVINAYRGSATLRLRVGFRPDDAFSRKIESWLMFSLAKGVEGLELDCKYDPLWDSWCEFPSVLPGQYPTLVSLKSLILKGLVMTSDSLEHLLQGSQLLERLELCDVESLEHVIVSAGPMSRLKSIYIYRCYGMKSIQISAPTPDLVSFIYPGWVKEVHLEHAPQLAELSWNNVTHWLPHLPDLRRLKHLYLSILGLEYVSGQGNHTRSKLRGLASLVNAASCVQHLTLEVDFLDSKLKIRDEFADLDLQHLQVIEILGFRGRRVECELALCLIKGAAASLEKLIINLRRNGECNTYYSWKEIDRWTSPAKKLIEKEGMSKVDLVFTVR